MNTTGFNFLALNSPVLWQQGRIETDEQGNDTLRIDKTGVSLTGYRTHVLTETLALGNLRPVDFALDGCGLVYLLDATSKAIIILDPGTSSFERVGCLTFDDPRAIAVDGDNVYVADGSQVLCLARANYQIRWQFSIEAGLLDDLAVGVGQSLYLLDTNGRQVYKVDKTGASLVSLSEALERPVAIAADKDGKLHVLEGDSKQVLGFGGDGALERSTAPVMATGFQPSSLAIDPDGNLYVGDRSEQGNLIRIDPAGKTTLVGYQGSCFSLAFSSHGEMYVLGEREMAFLRLSTRYASKGVYVTSSFDSARPDCQWHKVVLDADIPANTRISVRRCISPQDTLPSSPDWSDPLVNFKDALIQGPRGRYLWFRIELISDDLHVSTPALRSLQAYFPRLSYLRYLPATYQEDNAGREFLERFLSVFETSLSGLERAIAGLGSYFDAESTPDAFLPWLSAWMAIAYDEDWGADKVRKLISMAPDLYRKRGTRDGIEQMIELYTGQRPITIENFQLNCQQEILVKTKLTGKAIAGQRRLDVANSADFQSEGIVKIGESEEFAVVDRKEGNALMLRGRLRSDHDAGSVVRLVSVQEALYGNCPFQFCILLKLDQVHGPAELNAVRRIVEREKPAHTVGGVKDLHPWLFLDMHTYLGINTILTRPVFVIGQSSVLSRDTSLSEREDSGQIDLRSRVAIDTRLT